MSIHAYSEVVEPKSSETSMLFSVMGWRGFDLGYLFFLWLISIAARAVLPHARCVPSFIWFVMELMSGGSAKKEVRKPGNELSE